MKIKLIIIGCAIALITGCHSYDVNGSRPVRYASGVQVTTYDTTPRKPSSSIQVFDDSSDVHQPHHVIALLSHEGFLEDKALLVNALIWRAKNLGANGVIILPYQRDDYQFVPFGHSGVKYNFEARAIVFDDTPIPSK